jgi:hypothetical protein
MGHSTVMLSAAKHLAAHRDRPYASLRVTVLGPISSSGLFFETALSAFGGCFDIQIILLKVIIVPRWIFHYQDEKVKKHHQF